MSEYFLAHELSIGSARSCFCGDIDKDDEDYSKFKQLGCGCVIHYTCLIQHLESKLGDRNTMNSQGNFILTY